MIALLFAFRFIMVTLKMHGASQPAPLVIWCIVFMLVTLQLTTTLRPILGTSDKFMTGEKKFFLHHWADASAMELERESGRDQPQTESPPDREGSLSG